MNRLDRYYNALLSKQTREKAEHIIIWASIYSFFIHLALIGMVNLELITPSFESDLLTNPISAIYTPFSFILLFEVYLLVYHIPFSTSNYISKQYEIITLIVIRRIFKDLANLDLSENWFELKYDLQFTYDIISTLLLFLLIYLFHRLNKKDKNILEVKKLPEKVQVFIRRKKVMASFLVPVIVGMAVYSLCSWAADSVNNLQVSEVQGAAFMDINKIFFDEFFTLLILTDVLLLLFSFFHTTKFNLFIRNSGFIISTILIRISFSIDGFLNNILIVLAVLFGVLILLINRQYERLDKEDLEI